MLLMIDAFVTHSSFHLPKLTLMSAGGRHSVGTGKAKATDPEQRSRAGWREGCEKQFTGGLRRNGQKGHLTEGAFDGRWNFFGQKREGEDPGRGSTQVGLF